MTNIDGNVTVPAGTSCTLSFVNITGNVAVGQNATLVVSAYTEPCETGGNIEANNCNVVLLQGNVIVGGNLNINACNGTASNGFQGPDVLIRGNFACLSNAGPSLAWLGTIDGNVQIQSNNAQAASDVSLVSVGGNLDCQGIRRRWLIRMGQVGWTDIRKASARVLALRRHGSVRRSRRRRAPTLQRCRPRVSPCPMS